jgi:methylenetetrahydrofolate reductase (NADPH)
MSYNPRFEVMPFDSVKPKINDLPVNSSVAVTTSEQLGIEKTINFCEEISSQDRKIIPHIASRYIQDEKHFDEIYNRLKNIGVEDVFIPAGDLEDAEGRFESSYDLIKYIKSEDLNFDRIGVTGYPEGHEFLSKETLWEYLELKSEIADYIVTQICFDPEKIIAWAEKVQSKSYNYDIVVGVPGVVEIEKMIKISRKIGVGDSLKFVKKTTGVIDFLRNIISSKGRYNPESLVQSLEKSETVNFSSYHFYTFNRIESTSNWFQRTDVR